MKRLLAFGRFADDPQGILAAVQRLAIVSVERRPNLGIRPAKLRTTAFAYGESGILFDDPQFALWHENSLAANACANETAPVPASSISGRSEPVPRVNVDCLGHGGARANLPLQREGASPESYPASGVEWR